MIEQGRLKEVLSYDPETGVFRWIKKPAPRANRIRVGNVAGCEDHYGYILIGVDRILYGAHRLAWLYVNGELPDEVDHRNGEPSDNRLSNLRGCTHAQNLGNAKRRADNLSGFKGVQFHAQTGKWRARMRVAQRSISLGLYETKEQAHEVYCSSALRHYGEFARFQ